MCSLHMYMNKCIYKIVTAIHSSAQGLLSVLFAEPSVKNYEKSGT